MRGEICDTLMYEKWSHLLFEGYEGVGTSFHVKKTQDTLNLEYCPSNIFVFIIICGMVDKTLLRDLK